MPFLKIEDGYIQCIHNPHIANGFIAVQVVEPSYLTDNTVFHVGVDATEQELETDEARRVNAQKKEKNDMFRLNQHRYGQLHEEDPIAARNAKQLGIISFYEYTAERGFWCTHSFFVPNPVLFQHNGYSTAENFLYKGHNGEVFFFNQAEVVSNAGIGQEIHYDLQLQILQSTQNAHSGELSRETSENCSTYNIEEKSQLYDFILNGRATMREYYDVYMLNPVPTLIEDTGTGSSHNQKYVVFSHCSNGRGKVAAGAGPALFFYNVRLGRETSRLLGGEAFIDYFSNPD